jgi:GT2 family glycosyltransferase
MNERVTIVIVSYNCRDALRECLRKLTAGGVVPPIFVVANASSDNSAELVARDFPAAQLIKNAASCGFAVACNQGIRASASDFILLLAPKTLLDRAELQKLYDAIRIRPDVGVCAPRILNPDRSLHPTCRSFPTLTAMIYDELGLTRLFPHSGRFARYRMGGWGHDETREVDQVGRSCLLVRRTALEHVGLFDERFFSCLEDADLCWQLRQGGWRVLFVADATATQVGDQGNKTDRAEALGHWYQGLFAFYRKHYPRWQLLVLRFVMQIAGLFRTITGQRHYWPIVKNVWKL